MLYIKMAKDLGIPLWVSQFQALVSWITLIEGFPFSLKEVLMLPIKLQYPIKVATFVYLLKVKEIRQEIYIK